MKLSFFPQTRKPGFFSVLFVLGLLLTGCTRSGADDIDPNPLPQYRNVNLFLSDAPADFQQVLIDIQKIEVKIDLDATHENDDYYGDNDDDYDDTEEVDAFGRWVSLNVNPVQLDVLSLRNGLERLMGTALVGTRIRKVRITLGHANTLIDGDGRFCRLSLVNDTENFIYARVKSDDMDNSVRGTTDLRVDFDLARSIVPDGDEYLLTPQIRLFNLRTSGSVSGMIIPGEVGARVRITDGRGFETGAIPAFDQGIFRVRGLRPGVAYTLTVQAPNYHDYEIRDVVVNAGEEIELPEINLY